MKPEEYEKYVDITGKKFIKYYVFLRLVELFLGLVFISIAFGIAFVVLNAVISNVLSSIPK